MKDNRARFGKIKIKDLMIIWILVTLGVIVMLFETFHAASQAVGQQKSVTEKNMRCLELAQQVQSGSDVLTDAVWRFVATGDVQYAEEYLKEVEVTRSRDQAILKLRKEGLSKEELQLMEDAKEESDELMVQELECMKLVYESEGIEELPSAIANVQLSEEDQGLSGGEKRAEALRFVFGDEYARAKAAISNEIDIFTESLDKRQSKEVFQAMRYTDKAQRLQQITAILLLAWCIGFQIFFYWIVIRPIHACCRELDDAKNRERGLKPQGSYELQCLISAFNKSISQIQDKKKEIADIQMVDPVTGGYTATRFDLEMVKYLQEEKRFALASMDIRRFKLINDVYGSSEGDGVLKEVYGAVCSCLRPGECVSRIQSDIFNILLCETDIRQIEFRLDEINDRIDRMVGDGRKKNYHLSLNCGVYQVEHGRQDVVSIRDRANVARNISKSESGYLKGCVFYTELERHQLLKEQTLENAMEGALQSEEFLVYLQPKIRLSDGRAVGAEALVRWKSEEYGLIPPDEFIPLFEKNGFILKLDYYMFEQVCRLLRNWLDSHKKVLPISVNLSRMHLGEAGFIQRYKEIQERYRIPCELLEFELTEAMVFEDLPRLKEIIAELHEAGYRCSMDDFGSGYSSLNVLKDIPVDILKLDRGFFMGGETERGVNVVKAVLHMARELHMKTVAEGIETSSLVNFLKEEGCDMVQGYVFYKPMPAREFEYEILEKESGTVV